jgi:hypothetical protein
MPNFFEKLRFLLTLKYDNICILQVSGLNNIKHATDG